MKYIKLLLVAICTTGACAASTSSQLTPLEGYDYFSKMNNSISLKEAHHVLLFLSTTCPCSNSHIGHIKKLVQQFPEVRFVGIHSNQNESKVSGEGYFKKLNFPYAIIRDEGALIADRYGALKTPHAFVISKKGETLYAGPITDSRSIDTAKRFYLKDFLSSVTTGQKFKPVKKRPLGCYIYRGVKKG